MLNHGAKVVSFFPLKFILATDQQRAANVFQHGSLTESQKVANSI